MGPLLLNTWNGAIGITEPISSQVLIKCILPESQSMSHNITLQQVSKVSLMLPGKACTRGEPRVGKLQNWADCINSAGALLGCSHTLSCRSDLDIFIWSASHTILTRAMGRRSAVTAQIFQIALINLRTRELMAALLQARSLALIIEFGCCGKMYKLSGSISVSRWLHVFASLWNACLLCRTACPEATFIAYIWECLGLIATCFVHLHALVTIR